LATIDENGNCTSGIDYIWYNAFVTGNPDYTVGSQDPTRYLNIHILAAQDSWSVIPGPGLMAPDNPNDAIVLSYWHAMEQPRTLSHLMGHWLGLYHTFGNSGTSGVECGDDGVADTPETAGSPAGTCDTTLSTCNPGIIENVDNFMDYSTCGKMFTAGQAARVAAVLTDPDIPRIGHYADTTLAATGVYLPSTCPVQASMYTTTANACDSTRVHYYALVTGQEADMVQWSFPGGYPATSSSYHPEVAYPESGMYTAQLVVCHQGDCDTVDQVMDVTVNSPAINGLEPLPGNQFSEGFENGFTLPQAHMMATETQAGGWQPCSIAGYASPNSLYVPAAAVTETDTATLHIGNFAFNGGVPSIHFKVATTNYGTVWPQSLHILIYAPCDPLQTMTSAAYEPLDMAGGNSSMDFVPDNDDQWLSVDDTFPEWANSTHAEVCLQLIRFVPPNYGDPEAVYIDDINIGNGDMATGVSASASPGPLVVSPNPAHGSLMLRGLPRGTSQVRLLDLAGRMVMKGVPTGAEMVLDITHLNPGIYVVAVDGFGVALRKRCVVE
jgi:hypothetical protein